MDKNNIARKIIDNINIKGNEKLRIMEICGTHTQAIAQSGIRSLLPGNITLVSGPGCPVCVTAESHIDAAIEALNKHNVILAVFGDMMRVRGTEKSLSEQFGRTKRIIVVYSPLDCIELARKNPGEQVVFFGVGFETTAPGIALAVKLAADNKINNLSFITSLKLMPPVLHSILGEKYKEIHGIICPGHVAAVKGSEYFRFITGKYGVTAAVCGFEPLDIALGLYYISRQYFLIGKPGFANLYGTCVKEEGNAAANDIMQEVFETGDTNWRGIGYIKDSALILQNRYSYFNALERFGLELMESSKKQKCNCRDVLLGNIAPNNCALFGRECTPQKPAGPCMVSVEGSCSAYYRYLESGC